MTYFWAWLRCKFWFFWMDVATFGCDTRMHTPRAPRWRNILWDFAVGHAADLPAPFGYGPPPEHGAYNDGDTQGGNEPW